MSVLPPTAIALAAHALADWHEDIGPVLWWLFPVAEAPYVGTPLDTDWPGYHTHWTPLPVSPDDITEVPEPSKMPRGYVSHSQLSTFEMCGERYRRRYIEGHISPPGVAALRGRAVHGAAKVNFRQKVQSGTDLPLADLVDAAATTFDSDAQKGYTLTPDEQSRGAGLVLGNAKDRAVAMTVLLARDIAPTVQPALVEEEIRLPKKRRDPAGEPTGGTIELLGVVDLVTTQKAIRDFKTAGRRPDANQAHTSTQLSWYALSYRALTGEWPAELQLDVIVDTKVPKLVRLPTQRGLADAAALDRRIDAMCNAVEAGIFIPAPVGSWWCSARWCGYWATCPFVNAERVAAAESEE